MYAVLLNVVKIEALLICYRFVSVVSYYFWFTYLINNVGLYYPKFVSFTYNYSLYYSVVVIIY